MLSNIPNKREKKRDEQTTATTQRKRKRPITEITPKQKRHRQFNTNNNNLTPKQISHKQFNTNNNISSVIKPDMSHKDILLAAKNSNNLKWYNQLISENAKRKQTSLALDLFNQLKSQGHKPDVFTYTCIINALVRGGSIDQARMMFDEMNNNGIKPNTVTYTTLIKGYTDVTYNIPDAFSLLNEMESSNIKPNLRTYNTLLRGCLRCGDISHGIQIYKQILTQGLQQDPSTYNTIIKLLSQHSRIKEANEKLLELEAMSKKIDPSVYLVLASASALENKKSLSKQILNKLNTQELSPTMKEEKDHLEMVISSEAAISVKRDRLIYLPQQKINWSKLSWDNPSNPLYLEICSGMGEWIISRCQQNENINWVALEQRYDRVHQIWTKMMLHDVQNLFILGGEAYKILTSCIFEDSVDSIFVNFPNPPHEESNSVLLFTVDFVNQVHRVLKVGTTINILTDDKNYAMLIKEQFTSGKARSFTVEEGNRKLDDKQFSTYFDQLWKERGRAERFLLTFKKIDV